MIEQFGLSPEGVFAGMVLGAALFGRRAIQFGYCRLGPMLEGLL